jgi:hypothetical protein
VPVAVRRLVMFAVPVLRSVPAVRVRAVRHAPASAMSACRWW